MAHRAKGLKVSVPYHYKIDLIFFLFFQIHFPNSRLIVKPKSNLVTAKGTIEFFVDINLTKYEIKQQLKQIYGIDVIKVNTIIYNGKMKKDSVGKYFKRKATKKAIVTVDNTFWLDQQFQSLGGSSAEGTTTETTKE